MTNGSLMKVKSIAEISPWSILQYFWHALSEFTIFCYHEMIDIMQLNLCKTVTK